MGEKRPEMNRRRTSGKSGQMQRRRTPDMKGLRRYLSENIDGDYAKIILRDNPRRILKGKDVVPAS